MKRPSYDDDVLRRSLNGLAAALADTGKMPAPHLIWLRAQRERRRIAVERATRPLRVIEALTLVCALVLSGFLLRHSAATLKTPAALELLAGGAAIVLASGVVLWQLARRPAADV